MLRDAQHALPCRLTNRWEASLWLKGRQLYLGGFNSEEDAARAYDIVALSCKGLHVATNFPSATYTAELAELASSTQVWLQNIGVHMCDMLQGHYVPTIRGIGGTTLQTDGLMGVTTIADVSHEVNVLRAVPRYVHRRR